MNIEKDRRMNKQKRAFGIFFGLLFTALMGWGFHWLLTHEASRGHWWVAVSFVGFGFLSTVWRTIKHLCDVGED